VALDTRRPVEPVRADEITVAASDSPEPAS
jgi:hypothetical protein